MSNLESTIASTPDMAMSTPHVLYADDVRELRHLMQVTLATAGWQITCVNDGTDAWNEIQRHPGRYDIVITDHHMPEMSGLALVQLLRESGFPGCIIVVSSELGEPTDLAYREFKVDALLKKPVKFSQLPALLRELTASRDCGHPL